jgi:hypothetical protein
MEVMPLRKKRTKRERWIPVVQTPSKQAEIPPQARRRAGIPPEMLAFMAAISANLFWRLQKEVAKEVAKEIARKRKRSGKGQSKEKS